MKIMLIIFLSGVVLPNYSVAQWFDSQTLNATVLLEKDNENSIESHGTGFILYNYDNPDFPIIVTAGHLLLRSSIYVSLNADTSFVRFAHRNNLTHFEQGKIKWSLSGNRIRILVELSKSPNQNFVIHPTLDIGAFMTWIPPSLINSSGDIIVEKVTDVLKIPKSSIRSKREVSLGDEIYFVGFPFGIGSAGKIEPLIRSGSIAWLPSDSPEFLLDAVSYGGNSGSPVFTKRLTEPSRLVRDQTYLIGMVVGHLEQSYNDILKLPDPGQKKVQPVDIKYNIGLAQCVGIDDILKVVEEVRRLDIPEKNK